MRARARFASPSLPGSIQLDIRIADHAGQPRGLLADEGAEFLRRIRDYVGALLDNLRAHALILKNGDCRAVKLADDGGRRSGGSEQSEPGPGAIVESALFEGRDVREELGALVGRRSRWP